MLNRRKASNGETDGNYPGRLALKRPNLFGRLRRCRGLSAPSRPTPVAAGQHSPPAGRRAGTSVHLRMTVPVKRPGRPSRLDHQARDQTCTSTSKSLVELPNMDDSAAPTCPDRRAPWKSCLGLLKPSQPSRWASWSKTMLNHDHRPKLKTCPGGSMPTSTNWALAKQGGRGGSTRIQKLV